MAVVAICVVAFFAILNASCEQGVSRVAGQVWLTEADDGRSVDLGVGQTLNIALKANPATGYGWETLTLDERVLRLAAAPEFTPESDRLGAPGTQVLRFEVVGPGEADLQLVYRRPWEQDATPANTFSVHIVAQSA
jgi:inhibitor of cysteine peptidase